ncbi:MAG: hypothetical protein JWN24_3702 [Phycisphaerales bacterium]|nr:hypothetical protein [Phycisphaerales bacterium]
MKPNAIVLFCVALAFGVSWSGDLFAAENTPAPGPDSPATLDISKPFEKLSPVTPDSSPQSIDAAIQSRLDYLHEHNLPGRVFIPAGRWRISRPLFMNGDRKEIVGAGVGQTVIEAAEGYRAMPMINAGTRTEVEDRPLQACNRVRLTDSSSRMLDDSVTGERFGLRTYAEYPSDHFPAIGHQAAAMKEAKSWAKGTSYKANDVVALQVVAAPGQLQAVCIAEHASSDQSQPLKGADWKKFWVVKVPAHVQFFGDPLSAGAYNPVTRRAGNWTTMEHFTLDFAFGQNVEPTVYGNERVLCGAVLGDCSQRIWALVMHENGDLTFNLTLKDGATKIILLARNCNSTGVYRLAAQIDFPSGTARAWLRKPGENDFTRTCNDEKTIPKNSRFKEMEFGYFVIASGDGSASCSNGREAPPTDLTVCGLHMSAALRYADGEKLLRRGNDSPTDDNSRYFANDDGAMAFLPLTDNPSENESKTAGLLVTVQHGSASGDAGQKGYGYLKVPVQVWGIGAPRVSDLTLKPGPTWGAGVVNWHTLNLLLCNLDIRGGFYAVGDLFYGAQYPCEVRNCLLSGSEAAFSGSSNVVYMKDVTIDPVGRFGILASGCNMTLDGVKFRDPQAHQSEYYFRHTCGVLYGGMNRLTDVTADAPAGSQYPSRAAFSQQNIWIYRTNMVMRNCSVSNMGPDAAFLELPFFSGPNPARLLVENCSYAGSPIAAWVRTDSPWWSGEVTGFDPNAPVAKYLDSRPPHFPDWKAGAAYRPDSSVIQGSDAWQCIAEHTADSKNQPDGPDGTRFWKKMIPTIAFVPRGK